jgi:hypothetical protein
VHGHVEGKAVAADGDRCSAGADAAHVSNGRAAREVQEADEGEEKDERDGEPFHEANEETSPGRT